MRQKDRTLRPKVEPRRMLYRRTKKNRTAARNTSALIESLESRQLLSASDIVMHSNLVIKPDASASTTVQGFTPAQIRQAYGFDKISFSNGAVTGDGSGQTIAIVDAYNDPNIQADLKTFDTQFGIAAPPSFSVVSQTGSTTKLPTTDAGWASEISLDVEWAHAIAPGANILLVEANSATLQDLMTAVNYARHATGDDNSFREPGAAASSSVGARGSSPGRRRTTPTSPRRVDMQGVTFVAAARGQRKFLRC